MSNSTRQGGYDERLVVPLEASRRGAHRARTNPLVAALPLLAVVVVVAAVIGVAYALFLKPGGETSASDPLGGAGSSPTATGAAPSQSSSQPAPSQSPSTSASSSASSSTAPAPTVNKSASISVYNGTSISGLARTTTNKLVGAGFIKAQVNTNKWTATQVSETTVYYVKADQQATAEAIAKALGGGKTAKLQTPTGRITVVAFQ